MPTEAQIEVLNAEYDLLIRMGDFMESADPRGWIRQSNVLLDACLEVGMSIDEADHQAWAGRVITDWLFGKPLEELGLGWEQFA